MISPDELKEELKKLGVNVYPDMTGPVSLVDYNGFSQPIEAKVARLSVTDTVQEIATWLMKNPMDATESYKNFAFYQIVTGPSDDQYKVRFATWDWP